MTSLTISPTASIALGCALGLALGLGLVLVILFNPWLRPRNVEERLDAYVRRGSGTRAFGLYETPFFRHPFAERVVQPRLDALFSTFARVLGSTQSIETRLRHAGLQMTVQHYRMQQVTWTLVAGIGAAALAGLVMTSRSVSVSLALVAIVLAAVCGALARDYYLTHKVKARMSVLAREFPTVADLLALAIAAGESPLAAMDRVARTSKGSLARELALTVSEIRAGAGIEDALMQLGRRTPLDSLSRFSETIAVALERGTPLADVVRAQAQDARDASSRELMETAGKREIYMLIPVVFFLMPLVIVFAIFPGLSVLDIGQ